MKAYLRLWVLKPYALLQHTLTAAPGFLRAESVEQVP
jgi:hypothetical protein